MTSYWNAHYGERAPELAPGTMVYVRLRDGYETIFAAPFEDFDDWWIHTGSDEDIVMYSVYRP